jgi:hypothetical protein
MRTGQDRSPVLPYGILAGGQDVAILIQVFHQQITRDDGRLIKYVSGCVEPRSPLPKVS